MEYTGGGTNTSGGIKVHFPFHTHSNVQISVHNNCINVNNNTKMCYVAIITSLLSVNESIHIFISMAPCINLNCKLQMELVKTMVFF